jgi:hypothetical protein
LNQGRIRGARGPETCIAMNRKGGKIMHVDFNSILLLVIAVEVALVYVKLPRK